MANTSFRRADGPNRLVTFRADGPATTAYGRADGAFRHVDSRADGPATTALITL